MPNILPSDAKERKTIPLASGVLDYFTQALIEVAKVSFEGNNQHNPGEPLHWARGKSQDQADTMLRHFTERGTLDTDGMRHSAKMAWRALAILELEMEAEGYPIARGATDPGKRKKPPVETQEAESLAALQLIPAEGYPTAKRRYNLQIPCGEDYRSDGSGHF